MRWAAKSNNDSRMRPTLIYVLLCQRLKMYPVVCQNRPRLRGGERELIGVSRPEPTGFQRSQRGKTTGRDKLGNQDAHVLV